MKNKKAKIILVIIILVIIQLTLLYLYFKDDIKISKNTTTTASLENVEVSYERYELSNEIGSYIAKVALSDKGITVDGNGVTVKDNIIIITKAGTYYITGTISDASIQINCKEDGNVQLVLDNVNISVFIVSILASLYLSLTKYTAVPAIIAITMTIHKIVSTNVSYKVIITFFIMNIV